MFFFEPLTILLVLLVQLLPNKFRMLKEDSTITILACVAKYFPTSSLIRIFLFSRSSESSFVNMTAGAADDVSDSLLD